jgi:hypothetical protein
MLIVRRRDVHGARAILPKRTVELQTESAVGHRPCKKAGDCTFFIAVEEERRRSALQRFLSRTDTQQGLAIELSQGRNRQPRLPRGVLMAFISILQPLIHCKAPLDCLRAGVLQSLVHARRPWIVSALRRRSGGAFFCGSPEAGADVLSRIIHP